MEQESIGIFAFQRFYYRCRLRHSACGHVIYHGAFKVGVGVVDMNYFHRFGMGGK
jgi:hypothetical protein